MEQAHVQKRPEIGLLLDQEKAYDRVHPLYLRQTMLAFGFPPSLVYSLESLFFGNAVRININGYFTNKIDQRHGLQQGDPLSPLLFNIALEPFLRHILQGSSFQGFQFQFVSNSATTTSNTMPPLLKVIAYADDVCYVQTRERAHNYILLTDSHFFITANSTLIQCRQCQMAVLQNSWRLLTL
jgi:hypothetical protein